MKLQVIFFLRALNSLEMTGPSALNETRDKDLDKVTEIRLEMTGPSALNETKDIKDVEGLHMDRLEMTGPSALNETISFR